MIASAWVVVKQETVYVSRFSSLVCRCESQLNEKRKTRNVVYFRVLAINSAAECGAISLAVNSPRNSPSDFPLQ